jgi:hypothetical protein
MPPDADSNQSHAAMLMQTMIANVATLVAKIDALVSELNHVAIAVGRLEERMNAADEAAAKRECPKPGACLDVVDRLKDHEERIKPLEARRIEDDAAIRARERTQRLFTIGLSTATGLGGATIGAVLPTLLQHVLQR